MKTLRVIVSGRVQGVWFRAWTAEQATALGLSGNVRNRRDGSVEAVLSGPEDPVDQMVRKLWQGPPLAHVDGVQASPCAPPTDPGFHTLPTA